MQNPRAFEEDDSLQLTVNSYRSLQLNSRKSRRFSTKRYLVQVQTEGNSGDTSAIAETNPKEKSAKKK
jgi:hypothetical protein